MPPQNNKFRPLSVPHTLLAACSNRDNSAAE
jgi:hypothetical protein